jgi:hypothetical protein
MEYHETEGPIALFTNASRTPHSFYKYIIKIGDNHVMKGQTLSKHILQQVTHSWGELRA